MTNIPPTSVSILQRAQEIGHEEGLHFVYLGNVPGESNTYCPNCGRLLILRQGYWIGESTIRNGRCSDCGTQIDGVWGIRE